MSDVAPAARRRIVLVAVCTFVPTALLAVIWAIWRPGSALGVEPTAFHSLRIAFASLLGVSQQGDSWGPMMRAAVALHDPDPDQLYKRLFFIQKVRFQYPPSSLLFLDGLKQIGIATYTGLNRLNLVFYTLNAAGVALLTWKVLRPAAREIAMRMAVIAGLAALIFYPVARGLALGQIQIWIDLLFTGAMLAWVYERRGLAGVLVGFATAIKPQFALLLLWGGLWGEWTFVLGFLGAVVPMAALSLYAYGFGVHEGYLGVLSFLSRNGESYFANNSINGILNAYLSPTPSLVWDADGLTPYVPIVHLGTLAASVLALALIVVPAVLGRRRRLQPNVLCFAAAAVCTVIGSPVAWEHHYGILLPIYPVALAALLTEQSVSHRGLRLAALALSWAAVANFIPLAPVLAGTPWRALDAHFFLGGLLLLAVLQLRGGLALASRSSFRVEDDYPEEYRVVSAGRPEAGRWRGA